MRSFFLLLLLCPLLAFAETQPIADSTSSELINNKSSLLTTTQDILSKLGTLDGNLIFTIVIIVVLLILCVLIVYWYYVKRIRKTVDNNDIVEKWSEFFSNAHEEFENFKIKMQNADKFEEEQEQIENFQKDLMKKLEDIDTLFEKEELGTIGKNPKKNGEKKNIYDSFRSVLGIVDNIKNQIIQAKQIKESEINTIKSGHAKEIQKMQQQYAEELRKAKNESSAYRNMFCFVNDDEKEYVKNYALDVLKLIDLADTKVHEVLKIVSKSEDTIIKAKAGEFIFQFENLTQTPRYRDWISELLILSKTGVYMYEKKKSKISEILSGTNEQFDNLKYRLHNDFFSKYCSALLIFYQKMKSIENCFVDSDNLDKIKRKDLETIKKFFSEKDYTKLLELIKNNIGYSIVEVDLFKMYAATDQDIIEIVPCSNDNYDKGVVLDILNIGVNYGTSKNKTKIKLNEK